MQGRVVKLKLGLHVRRGRTGRSLQRCLSFSAAGAVGQEHEANLPRGIGGDGGVGVFDVGEDVTAGLVDLGDEVEVQPLAFGLRADDAVRVEGLVEGPEEGGFEQGFGGAYLGGIRK